MLRRLHDAEPHLTENVDQSSPAFKEAVAQRNPGATRTRAVLRGEAEKKRHTQLVTKAKYQGERRSAGGAGAPLVRALTVLGATGRVLGLYRHVNQAPGRQNHGERWNATILPTRESALDAGQHATASRRRASTSRLSQNKINARRRNLFSPSNPKVRQASEV